MFVATKASTLKRNAEKSFQSVTFHKKVKKQSPITKPTEESPAPEKISKKNEVADMKKLRYEIIKFGTSGFSGALKEDANTALLVSLGAEPPKKKGRNYKELLEEKKKKPKSDADFNEKKYKAWQTTNKQTSKHNPKKRKKDVKGLLDVYGEVKNVRKGGKRRR